MPLLNQILQPYLRSKELWHCPSDSGYTELDISAYVRRPVIPLDATPTAFQAFGTSYLYRTEIALLGTRLTALLSRMTAPVTSHEGAEVNVLMDGNGSWHGGYLTSQKRYDELMGDGHVINQDIAQFGQTWQAAAQTPGEDPGLRPGLLKCDCPPSQTQE